MLSARPEGREVRCPVCSKETLRPTGLRFGVADTLRRWEQHVASPFPRDVTARYCATPDAQVELGRCANCEVAFFLPMLEGDKAFYQHINAIEGDYYVTDGKWEFDYAIGRLKAAHARRVLDYGCGRGDFLKQLNAALDHEAYGYDFGIDSDDAADPDSARFRRIKGVSLADVGGRPVDAVCLFQILEHVADPLAMLRTATSVLRRGGLVVLAVPDDSGPVSLFPAALTNLPPHHLSRWTPRALEELVRVSGLRLVEIRTEQMPRYLWNSYVPTILEQGRLGWIGWICNRLLITSAVLGILRMAGVKVIPWLKGHSIVALCEKTDG